MTVRSVRLVASEREVERRLTARYPDRPAALRWHLDRHLALSRQLEDASADELVIDTEGRSPREVAHQVLAHFG